MAFLGKMEYDGLVIDSPYIEQGTIAHGDAAASLKRGTLLKLNSSNKLEIANQSPNCILAEDVEVSATADAKAMVYKAGVFNENKLILAENYTISAADRETLRGKQIFLKAAQD